MRSLSTDPAPGDAPVAVSPPPPGVGFWTVPIRLFETMLWQSRFFTIVAVAASFALWLVMLFITTVDALYLVQSVIGYADPALGADARLSLRAQAIGGIVGVLDGYLIASALFIFTLGLYRQFVSRLSAAEGSEVGRRLLSTSSFEDLKGRLANTIILILIVKFLQQALGLPYTSMTDIVLLAFGTLLVGGALYLSHNGTSHQQEGGKTM